MKIGYPCINRAIGCTANTTFRLNNYSEENLISKVENNLNCLEKILEYNVKNKILFFRISSDLVPFASHPICTFDWKNHFKKRFKSIGNFIKKNLIRISMHPDQFVLINSKRKDVIEKSILELKYHCDVLDLMELDDSAKVQIHVGGVYGDKNSAIKRFIENYSKLSISIKKRLAIENDDKLFSLKDCLNIHKEIKIPIIFDSFHHICLNNGEDLREAILTAKNTWKQKDGVLMTDYSSQEINARKGKHTESIDLDDFKNYLNKVKDIDFDIMLEIKDKEKSAIKVLNFLETFNS